MADAKRVAPTDGLGALTNLLGMFGQKSSSSSSANTAPLEQILAQLQGGTDPTKLLESIFQQASANIPRLQAAYGNAIGARSGGNSAVQGQLNELLKATTLAGQQQVMQQQQNNQNMQLGAAGKIADSTRRTTTTQGPNTAPLGKAIAALQGYNQLSKLYDKGKNALGGLSALGAGGAGADALSSADSNIFSNFLGDTGGGFFSPASEVTGSGLTDIFSSTAGDIFETGSGWLGDAVSGGGDFLSDAIDTGGDWLSDIGSWFGFADGGLVGRDGQRMKQDSIAGYADGGIVRSGGGRRSSAPTYTKTAPTRSTAVQGPGGKKGMRDENTGGMSEQGFGGVAQGLNGNFGTFDATNYYSQFDNGVGSGSTATGIPDIALSLAGSLIGVNPLVMFALKQLNKYANNNDPTNPGGKNATNGADAMSDAAAKGQQNQGFGDRANQGQNQGSNQLNFSSELFSRGNTNSLDNLTDELFGDGGSDMGFGNFDFGSAAGGDFGGGFDMGAGFGDFGGGGGGGSGGGGGGGGSSFFIDAAFNKGGEVPGPNVDADVVNARLTPGEYVIRKDVVDALGSDFFDSLNKLGM